MIVHRYVVMVYNGSVTIKPNKLGEGHSRAERSGRKALPHLDPLTQVLDGIRLRCMLPGAHEMTAPWGVRFGGIPPVQMRKHIESLGFDLPPHDPPILRGTIIAIIRGNCCLEVERHGVKLPLSGGDVVLIARDDPFVLRDQWRTPVKNIHELLHRENLETFSGVRYGGGGVPTTFLSGAFFTEDDEECPLLAALPPVIHIRSSELEAAPWLESTLKFLASEQAALLPGSQSIINHLAHVLFVQAVRAYAGSLPEDATGNWFQAVFDSDLSAVLGLIHSRPEESWTVASLAEQANIGRSAFAARFTAAVGTPPLQYLTEYRMRKARALLRDTDLGVKTIAAKVGYSNESAFSHAFRRASGMSPGGYRHSRVNTR